MGAGCGGLERRECLRICSSSICYFRSKVSLDSSSIKGEIVILEKDMLKHLCGKKKVGWLGNFLGQPVNRTSAGCHAKYKASLAAITSANNVFWTPRLLPQDFG